MPGRTVRAQWMVLTVAAVVVLALLAAGCGGSARAGSIPSSVAAPPPGPTSEISPDSQRGIAAAIATRAAQTPATGDKSPAKASGARTAADITSTAPSSNLLDGRHLAAGQKCESCHGALPTEGSPALPSTQKCLSCHGGSYTELARKGEGLGTANPHRSHEGPVDCVRCHRVHGPFQHYCNGCHNFSIPDRYQGGA